MDTQRKSLKSNLQVYEGDFSINSFTNNKFVNLLPPCLSALLHSKTYLILKLGTIYLYPSKRSYLNHPQKPSFFYNLSTSIFQYKPGTKKEKAHIYVRGMYSNPIKITSNIQEELLKLDQAIQQNTNLLETKLVYPKRFSDMQFRIKDKKEFDNQ